MGTTEALEENLKQGVNSSMFDLLLPDHLQSLSTEAPTLEKPAASWPAYPASSGAHLTLPPPGLSLASAPPASRKPGPCSGAAECKTPG